MKKTWISLRCSLTQNIRQKMHEKSHWLRGSKEWVCNLLIILNIGFKKSMNPIGCNPILENVTGMQSLDFVV